ncbi:MAG TPA: hypothetical protein VFE72_09780, partial [Lysobacter sp.]|nr:hypothetical protein [Lysobacter sp.]
MPWRLRVSRHRRNPFVAELDRRTDAPARIAVVAIAVAHCAVRTEAARHADSHPRSRDRRRPSRRHDAPWPHGPRASRVRDRGVVLRARWNPLDGRIVSRARCMRRIRPRAAPSNRPPGRLAMRAAAGASRMTARPLRDWARRLKRDALTVYYA